MNYFFATLIGHFRTRYKVYNLVEDLGTVGVDSAITIDVPIAISKSGCSLFTHSVHSEEDQSGPDGSEREQVQKTERFME